jgi:spore coat polysaccharide biosynthesis protein SpsF
MLFEVLTRCKNIPNIDEVWCAVPTNGADDEVAQAALEANAFVFRGSEDDVLERYTETAAAACADIIMRVTSDCPLIDPYVCGNVLALLKEKNADYACNNLRHEWAHGLDCETFTIESLKQANKLAEAGFEREHVTPWIRNNSKLQREHLSAPSNDMTKFRWTVDTPEDLIFIRHVLPLLPEGKERFAYQTVCELLAETPEILQINSDNIGMSRPQSVSTT